MDWTILYSIATQAEDLHCPAPPNPLVESILQRNRLKALAAVFLAFATTAALFAVMSVIGYTTQMDLSKMGTYLMMAVIGLVIAMVINIFVSSGVLDTIISMAGVLIFTALTAYDTQRISRMAAQMSMNGEGEIKFGIMGALKLYLDFINMFLFVLRLVGRRR